MVKEIRVYFEGDAVLRPGFDKFFGEIKTKASQRNIGFRFIATNATPIQGFRDGMRANPESWNVLLLDSEGPITAPLPDLCAQRKLAGHDDNVFWMVQIMESWFLADPSALKKYYKDGFQASALKGDPQVEQIPKDDILSRLKAATKKTKKEEYHKTAHAPDLLASIDPELVQAAAPNCQRLFDTLRARLAEA